MTATPTTEAQLAQILDWAAYLPALLTRHAPTGDGSRSGRRTPGSKPPVRLDILHLLDTRLRVTGDDAEDRAWHDRMAGDHRQGLLPDLWQWAKLIDGEMYETSPTLPAELPETPTLTSVVEWLLANLDWALTQPWAVELVRDIDWWWRRVRHLAGERDPYQPRCGRCLFPIEPRDGGWWRCLGCGAEISLDAGLKRLAEPVVTLAQAAEITGVPLPTLKSRVQAGALIPLAPSRYLLRDIERMVDDPPTRGRPPREAV